MTAIYTDLVLRTATMLSQSLLGLASLERAVGQGRLIISNDLARLQVLNEWLIKLELCAHEGNITNSQGFETFIYQVQGAMWAYADTKASSPTVQMVMATPNWVNPEKIRHTESVNNALSRILLYDQDLRTEIEGDGSDLTLWKPNLPDFTKSSDFIGLWKRNLD